MDEDLISKKELLALTGISYGALYRWKRKQLIPEDWFIKKSSFTGPETFFPRVRTLERIARIQDMKEDLSLDHLAQTFAGTPLDIRVRPQQLIERGLLSETVSRMKLFSPDEILDFYGALYLYICDQLLTGGQITLAESDQILSHLLADFKSFGSAPLLTVYRKMGVTFSLLTSENASAAADPDAKLIVAVRTAELWETLKIRWRAEK